MLLKVSEVASKLSVCTKTVYRRISDGSLPAVRLSEKDLRIDEKDLQKFVEDLKFNNA